MLNILKTYSAKTIDITNQNNTNIQEYHICLNRTNLGQKGFAEIIILWES